MHKYHMVSWPHIHGAFCGQSHTCSCWFRVCNYVGFGSVIFFLEVNYVSWYYFRMFGFLIIYCIFYVEPFWAVSGNCCSWGGIREVYGRFCWKQKLIVYMRRPQNSFWTLPWPQKLPTRAQRKLKITPKSSQNPKLEFKELQKIKVAQLDE